MPGDEVEKSEEDISWGLLFSLLAETEGNFQKAVEIKLNWKGLEQSVERNAIASWLGINEGPLSQLAGGPPVGSFLGPLALKRQDKAIVLLKVRPILLDGKSFEVHLY